MVSAAAPSQLGCAVERMRCQAACCPAASGRLEMRGLDSQPGSSFSCPEGEGRDTESKGKGPLDTESVLPVNSVGV